MYLGTLASLSYRSKRIFTSGGGSPTTALGILAASLSAGQWGQLTGISGQNSALGIGTVTGTMLAQTNQANWCSQTKTIEIVGQDHNGPTGGGWGMGHSKYDEATNTFSQVEFSSSVYGNGSGHSYDHVAINPYTGDLYGRESAGGTGGLQIKKKTLANRSVWVGGLPDSASHWYLQVAIGTCWWSGSFTAGSGAGAQGCFMIYNSGAAASPPGASTDGIISAFDPVANSWIYHQDGASPLSGAGGTGTLHSIMEYSPIYNVAVYGGGNDAERKLWKITSNGTVSAMTDVPSGKTVGVGVASTAGRLVTDPVTGKFLLLCSGQLWELDPTGSGTWTQKTNPPAGVGDPDAGSWVTSVSLPEHNCVAFIRQDNSTTNAFWLYKNA